MAYDWMKNERAKPNKKFDQRSRKHQDQETIDYIVNHIEK